MVVGVDLARPKIPVGKKTIVVLIAFVVMSSALVITGAAVQKVKDLSVDRSHDPIGIPADGAFTAANGVKEGSGAQNDPYIIENWRIASTYHAAITINDTSAFVVIRNCSIWSNNYHEVTDGISINRAKNIFMENLTIVGLRVGIAVNGSQMANSENITVKRSVLAACSYGILVRNASHVLVEGSLMETMFFSGMVVENCSYVQTKDIKLSEYGLQSHGYYGPYAYNYPGRNLVPHFPNTGIGFADSTNSTVWGSHLEGASYAVNYSLLALRCDNITVSNNSFSENSERPASVLRSTNVTMSNNTVLYHSFLSISDCQDCLLADNVIGSPYYTSDGILVAHTQGASVLRNMISGGGGITGHYMNDSQVRDNTVSGCRSFGLSLWGSRVVIAHNLVVDSNDAVRVHGDEVAFDGNIILSGRVDSYGSNSVTFWGCTDLSISNSSFSKDQFGIKIYGCSRVSMAHNNVSDPLTLSGDYNTTIWGNTMFNGSVGIDLLLPTSAISWDRGYPLGGNYWPGYAGVDVKSGPNQNQPGADGIGDTPYLISGSEFDNYPLMNASEVTDVEPPITKVELTGFIGERGWRTSMVNVSLSGFDARSAPITTHYRIDMGSWNIFGSNVTITSDGVHALEYYSTDWAGNEEHMRTAIVKIDTQRPYSATQHYANLSYRNTKAIMLEYGYVDNTSGIAELVISKADYFLRESITLRSESAATLSNGNNTYVLLAYDKAGNSNYRTVLIRDALNENKQLLSHEGPYGIWYLIGILADLVILGYLSHVRSVEVFGPMKPQPTRLEPGEIDKEQLIDGYPKYMKKM